MDKKSYFSGLNKKLQAAFTGSQLEVARIILKVVNSSYDTRDTYIDRIKQMFATKSDWSDSDLFQPFIDITTALLGKRYGDIIQYIVTHKYEFPYSESFFRRPFRTKNAANHIEGVIESFSALFELDRENVSLIDYLTSPNNETSYNPVISDVIAYELDHDNEQVFNALHEIIYGENNAALMNTVMIKGIFKSHREEAYKMLGDLLIAARLQEGLRQSIVESMDEGTIEASIYFLKLIVEHDLLRYSSVIRALDVWTGLDLGASKKRTAKKTFEYVLESLTDSSSRNEGLNSQDFIILYISLWATAVFEEEQVKKPIRKLMETGSRHQKTAAQFFLTQSQNSTVRFELSYPYLEEVHPELQFFLLQNYVYGYRIDWMYDENNTKKMYFDKVPLLEDKSERAKQFEQFKKMLQGMPKKEVTFEGILGEKYTLSSDLIVEKLLYLTLYDMDQEWLSQIIEWKDRISPDLRDTLLSFLVRDYSDPVQREFIFDSLSDKSMTIRETALKHVKRMELSEEVIEKVESILKLKTGTLRKSALQILLTLPDGKFDDSISRLLSSKQELQRLGALEMITAKKNKDKYKSRVAALSNVTPKEQILIDKLLLTEEFTKENGFGLFDPNRILNFEWNGPNESLIEFLTFSPNEAIGILDEVAKLIHEHRHVEYEVKWFDGSKETYHIGEELRSVDEEKEAGIDNLPLTDVWSSFFSERCLSPEELIQIMFYLNSDEIYRYYFERLSEWERREYPKLTEKIRELIKKIYPIELVYEFHTKLDKAEYKEQVKTVIEAYFFGQTGEGFFEKISGILNFFIQTVIDEKTNRKLLRLLVEPWQEWTSLFAPNDEAFKQYFILKYQLFSLAYFKDFHPSAEELARAYQVKLIDEQDIFCELLNRKDESSSRLQQLTRPKNEIIRSYPFMKDIVDRAVNRIVEIELKRGDLPTAVTSLLDGIERFEGIEYFIKILVGLEKESFVRGYIYGYESMTKKEALSYLLKACYPRMEDNEASLANLLKGQKISNQRLLEAAMYAPQWLDIVGKYLHWNELVKAAWYFHAHINEMFTEEKEAVVARYSPISPAKFQDGAFDINWFRESVLELGEERFETLYKCAKYISAGANHRRSQLFADAVRGKLGLEETKKAAHEKRNKDQLLAYSLIPLQDEHDTYRRYEFLQQFLKESKQYGSQRQNSEAKTVEIAFENLARNAGYPDVTRLKWDIESKKLDEIVPYLEPKKIEDVVVQLVIDEHGMAEILTVKNGKPLKSVPSKFNKHEYILELKQIRTDLRNQFKRAKEELEKSMMLETSFSLKEVIKIMKNPVLAPLLKRLVLKAGMELGYYEGGMLTGVNQAYRIRPDDAILIAHPVHLYDSGLWSDFQRDLFLKKVKQPFKQVFRELYLPNQDEIDAGTGTRRYAGHQIQPRKAVALLKGRKWTVDAGEGLQKVYYKENIIVRLYALADWFSPSDIECPTIEKVEFFDRNTYKPILTENIPKHIFSETMRDIDLVVSVAHVGGVDPEASLTTIEMRRAIVVESIRLMKLDNVRVEGNFALIEGKLGEYSVHLGSANVYKQATGAIFIVPVHSQQRGRIFLPFLDEDPKTAEIVSKVLLLAEDRKIKDPYILEQIK